jgi:hypothetical protein
MKKEVVDKLNAFEIWVWRRMEKVSWQDRKTNEEVLVDEVLVDALHLLHQAAISVAHGESEPEGNCRGVRLGCPLSSFLFPVYYMWRQ